MPLVFTKSEIKDQLLEFGFQADEEQLTEFIKDLKKLIKAEEKKRRERKGRNEFEGTGTTSPGTTTSVSPYSSTGTHTGLGTSTSTNDTTQGETGTDEIDEVKSSNLPQPQTQVQETTRRPRKPTDEKRILLERSNGRMSNGGVQGQLNQKGLGAAGSSSSLSLQSESITISSSSSYEGSEGRRLKLPPESVRHDPVSLYHFYKSIWEKQRGPGDDPRMQLRWNVRAGTLGKVPCNPDGAPTKYLRPPVFREVKNYGSMSRPQYASTASTRFRI